MLDTDAREPNAQTMDVLVDWTGEDAYPGRFVFLVGEARAPACVVDALAAELAARNREELNALYVAVTRAQNTLVLSSLQPRNPNPASWWVRLAPHAQALASEPAPSETDLTASQTDGTQVAQQVDTIGTASFELQLLPELPLEARLGATVKAVSVNNATAQGELAPDSGEARIGKATHRLIEWLPVCTGGYAALAAGNTKSGCRTPHWSDAQRASVATQFTLDAAQLAPAVQMAQSIVTGAGAWAWDADQLQWRHNEVPISRGGRLLRIDRLVQTRSDG